MMAWVVPSHTRLHQHRHLQSIPTSLPHYHATYDNSPFSSSWHDALSISMSLRPKYMSQNDDNENIHEVEAKTNNKLDEILSRLTSLFPFFVLSSATMGMAYPKYLTWVNRGKLITIMLASVMIGTGMTLEKQDFIDVFKTQKQTNSTTGSSSYTIIPAGLACQYGIMPLASYLVGTALLLNSHPTLGKHLFLGLALVGCSPGGTASNLVSLIAGADVALSVILTTASTILASLVTPLLATTLVGSSVAVSGLALCAATTRVVLLPVIVGMALNKYSPNLAKMLSRFTPFASVLLVSLICGGVVAQNAPAVLGIASSGAGGAVSSKVLLTKIITSVLLLHTLGFLVGYIAPKFGFKYTEKQSRTISIETGMQNSALAVVLARSIANADPIASLPGALSATAHSCLGSILAAYWRFTDGRRLKKEEERGAEGEEVEGTGGSYEI